jgi:hypothetical protein
MLGSLLTFRTRDVFTSDQNLDKCAVFMTPERIAYKTVQLVDSKGFETRRIAWYLLKFYEIIDAATHKLPRLQTIKAEHDTYSWDEPLPTRIKATKHDDSTLWVDQSDVKISFPHRFAGFNGYPADSSD